MRWGGCTRDKLGGRCVGDPWIQEIQGHKGPSMTTLTATQAQRWSPRTCEGWEGLGSWGRATLVVPIVLSKSQAPRLLQPTSYTLTPSGPGAPGPSLDPPGEAAGLHATFTQSL